jgi:hypothetical protein
MLHEIADWTVTVDTVTSVIIGSPSWFGGTMCSGSGRGKRLCLVTPIEMDRPAAHQFCITLARERFIDQVSDLHSRSDQSRVEFLRAELAVCFTFAGVAETERKAQRSLYSQLMLQR